VTRHPRLHDADFGFAIAPVFAMGEGFPQLFGHVGSTGFVPGVGEVLGKLRGEVGYGVAYKNVSVLSRTDGDDLASEAVKLKIRQIIAQENAKHPHSDQRIVELLRDQNIEIARRTVAKYREQLRILSSSKRRQVF